MIGLNKTIGDRRGIGFHETNSHIAFFSKNKFVPTSMPKVQNLRPIVIPKFTPTCHHCDKVGHIRPKCRELLNRNKTKNIGVREPKLSVKHKFPPPKVQNLKYMIVSKFILTCHNCGILGHIRLNVVSP